MKTLLKVIAWMVGIIAVVVVAAVVLVPIWFDPNDHKDTIADAVMEYTGRKIAIEGPLELTVFPWLGVKAGAMELGNAPGFKDPVLARANAIDVRVEFRSLLDGRLVADAVTLDGLELYLERNAKGVANWATPAGGGKSQDTKAKGGGSTESTGASSDSQFDLKSVSLGGIEIVDAKVSWRDGKSGQNVKLTKVGLTTGAISLTGPVDVSGQLDLSMAEPSLQGTIEFKGKLHHANDGKQIRAEGMALGVNLTGPTLPNGKLAGSLAADASVDTNAGTAVLKGLSLKVGDLQADGGVNLKGLNGKLGVTGKLSVARFNLREMLAVLGQSVPATADPAVLTAVAINMDLVGDANNIAMSPFNLTLDDSQIDGKLSVKNFEKPAYAFNLKTDGIDLDRYLPPKAAGQSAQTGATSSGSQASTAESAPSKGSSGEVIPVKLLRGLNVNGQLGIGKLKVNNLSLAGVVLTVKAKGGRVSLNPLRANLYGGSYAGNVGIDVRGKVPKMTVSESVKGVQLAPLLKDFNGEERLEGTAQARLKATTSGSTIPAIKAGLNGSGRILFENGAIKGYNLAAMIRDAKAKYLGGKPSTGNEPPRTDFSKMGGTFKVRKGIVDNRDFSAKIPLLRVSGKGKANLVKETIDYVTTISVVATSKGQGGKDLSDLAGLDIPVEVGGTFANPTYGFEGAISSMVGVALKNLVGGKVGNVLGGVTGGAGNLGGTVEK
ncbi:MAG: AsmA family protein, partial [Chromatiales bacterium]|nr:AsmA family protein [Chromatiales bacterium]